MPPHETDIATAEDILQDYGQVLSHTEPTGYGLPQSLLPHPKDKIKDAIQLFIGLLGDEQPELKESLIQGYVFLAQFIPDEDVRTIQQGYNVIKSAEAGSQDISQADDAARVINKIKLDMENLMEDLRVFMQ